MGYVVPRRTALIEFDEGHQYHGASARVMLDQPLGLVFEVDKLQGGGTESLEKMLQIFGDTILQSWNVTNPETGEPRPATYAGLKEEPFPFVMELIDHWKAYATTVDAPLAETSADGSPSEEEPETPSEMLSSVQPS